MNFERPTAEHETDRHDSRYGEANHATGQTRDERRLYGEPCHQVESRRDEQTLYGEPQHETREDAELPDLDLLFARMRAESISRPVVMAPGETSAVQTTER